MFGALPPSTHAVFWQEKHLRGSVHISPGDIQPQVPAGSGANSKKTRQKASSVSRGQAATSGIQSRGGQPFRGLSRLSNKSSQKQGVTGSVSSKITF